MKNLKRSELVNKVNSMVSEGKITLNKPAQNIKTSELMELVPSKGRPVNPNSKRQLRLKEKEMKRKNGELKRGRPVNPNSKRQMRIEKLEAKRKNGELKKGRPVNPNSKRQLRIQELEAKRKNGELKRGRPRKNRCTALILRERGY